MTEVVVEGHTYRTGRVPALEQFHIVRRLLPALGALGPVLGKLGPLSSLKETAAVEAALDRVGIDAVVGPLGGALAGLSDEDADYVLLGLLRYCQRREPNGTGWSAVAAPGAGLMFAADLSMPALLQLAWAVFRENLQGFFDAARSVSPDASRS